MSSTWSFHESKPAKIYTLNTFLFKVGWLNILYKKIYLLWEILTKETSSFVSRSLWWKHTYLLIWWSCIEWNFVVFNCFKQSVIYRTEWNILKLNVILYIVIHRTVALQFSDRCCGDGGSANAYSVVNFFPFRHLRQWCRRKRWAIRRRRRYVAKKMTDYQVISNLLI